LGKQNNKKVVRETRNLLTIALGNLLESERERKFSYKTKTGPKTRKAFCNKFHLNKSTVTWIETGRMLELNFRQIRTYLAAVRARDDKPLLVSFEMVFGGLKEIDKLLLRF
jgi:hypothetical protein